MKSLLKWITWLTAAVLAVLMILVQLATAKAYDEQKSITLFRVVICVVFGVVSQVGLFLSPWAINWKSGYKKIIVVLMLPSIFWIPSQLAADFGEFSKHFSGAFDEEFWEHIFGLIILIAILAVYLYQAVNLSTNLVVS